MARNESERHKYNLQHELGDSAEGKRREYEWNCYVNRDSPTRSATEDYPRHDEERRRVADVNYGRSRYRSRSRSPIIRRVHREDYDRADRIRSSWRGSSPSRRGSSSHDRSESYRRDSYSSSREKSNDGELRDFTRRACPTVAVRYIPSSVSESTIRDKLQDSRANYIDLKMDYEDGVKGATSSATADRVCYIEFETTRDAIQWMVDHQGVLRLGRDKVTMEYDNPDARNIPSRRRDNPLEYRKDGDRRSRRLGTPSEIMVVRGMNRDTTEDEIRKSFEYITQFPIKEIRVVRDKLGNSRGFCFIEWSNVDDCSQVIEYLRTATPRFHIQGSHVELDFSSPQQETQATGDSHRSHRSSRKNNGASRHQPNINADAAAAAIQAAHWSRGGNNKTSQQTVDSNHSTSTSAALKSHRNKINKQQLQTSSRQLRCSLTDHKLPFSTSPTSIQPQTPASFSTIQLRAFITTVRRGSIMMLNPDISTTT